MILVFFEKKLIHQFGFIFLATGFLKLGLFFLGIKLLNLEINKSVFLHFFVPYIVCVVFEIFYLVRVLNRANFKNTN
jgi:Na+/glutamate symporter